MNIAEQIKLHRQKKNWTQEELAVQLHVSRSTISSWEVGRTYPDLEMIVLISDLFEISLDELLRGDKIVLEKIADDTKTRKTQSKKIKYLWGGVTLLLICLLFFGYKAIDQQNLSDKNQITSVSKFNQNSFLVEVDLPKYRSIHSYFISSNSEKSSIMEITLYSKIDWSFSNIEEMEIFIDSYTFPKFKQINIVNQNGIVIETFDVNNYEN